MQCAAVHTVSKPQPFLQNHGLAAGDLAEPVEGDQRAAAESRFFSHLRFSNGIVRKNASAPAIRETVASIVSGARPTHTILLHADGACSRTCVRGRRPNMVGTSREGGASDGGVDAGAQAVAELRRGSAAHRGLRAATAKGGARPRCWAEHTRRGSGDGQREL